MLVLVFMEQPSGMSDDDYLEIWRWSCVSLRSSLTPSELALGSDNARLHTGCSAIAIDLWRRKWMDEKWTKYNNGKQERDVSSSFGV